MIHVTSNFTPMHVRLGNSSEPVASGYSPKISAFSTDIGRLDVKSVSVDLFSFDTLRNSHDGFWVKLFAQLVYGHHEPSHTVVLRVHDWA
jgi:hypothetical protein